MPIAGGGFLGWMDFSELDERAFASELTAGQRRLLEEIALPKRRREFTFSRLAYNRMLALFTKAAPLDVFPKDAPHPPVRDEAGPWFTSLSHSHGVCAVALARVPVAVDIERMRSRDFARLSRHLGFECEEGAEGSSRGFYAAWCARECRVKLDLPDACHTHVWEIALAGATYCMVYATREPAPVPSCLCLL